MHIQACSQINCFWWRYLWYVAVFGKVGLHMVLRGAVKPITDPHLNESNEVPDSRSSTPLLPEDNEKEVKLIEIFWLKYICFRWKKNDFCLFYLLCISTTIPLLLDNDKFPCGILLAWPW